MATAVPEFRVKSFSELLSLIMTTFQDDELVWYRGQSDAVWKLEPSLARIKHLQAEAAVTDAFQRDAVHLLAAADFRAPHMSEWDWMFVMQHYGVPTRLLDWTESPLAAAFFACHSSATSERTDACIWALKPRVLNEQGGLPLDDQWWAVPLCGSYEEADRYLASRLRERSDRKLIPIAVTGLRRFDRIRAQTGVFTIVQHDSGPLEDIAPTALTRVVIPAEAIEDFRREVSRLGFHPAVMYPDLQHIGSRIAESLK